MEFFSGKQKIGILGGGQLGKMLLSTTRQWDIPTNVMDPSDDAPSRIGCDKFVKENHDMSPLTTSYPSLRV